MSRRLAGTYCMTVILLLTSCTILSRSAPNMSTEEALTPAVPSRKILSSTLPWREVWRQQIGSAFTSIPLIAVSGNEVVLPIDKRTSTLVALNAQDGHTLWERPLADPQFPDRQVKVVHSIFADTKRVFVALPFAVMAFDCSDGRFLWITHRLPEHTSYYIYPDIEDDTLTVFGVYGDTKLYFINVNDGEIKSTEEYSGELLLRTPTAEYTIEGLNLVRVDRNIQEVLWKVATRGSLGTRRWPAFVNGNAMIFTTGPHLSSLCVIDPNSGKVLWQTSEDIVSNFALAGTNVYILNRDDELIAYDALTGRNVGVMQFGGGALDLEHASEYSIVAYDSRLFVYLGDSKEIIAFELE